MILDSLYSFFGPEIIVFTGIFVVKFLLLFSGLFIPLTNSEYFSAFKVRSIVEDPASIFVIIKVLQFTVKNSLRTIVSLLPLNCLWFLSSSMALIHSFNASRDLLISPASSLYYNIKPDRNKEKRYWTLRRTCSNLFFSLYQFILFLLVFVTIIWSN